MIMANNSRIKRVKSKSHVTINSAILWEKNVSLKAKGLFALVMSLPDTWDFSLKGICAITKEEYTAVNNSIKELIGAGYCRREHVKEHGKFTGYVYEFCEAKIGSPCLGFPNMENPNVENPNVENLKTNNNYSIILNNPIIEENKEDNSIILNNPVIDKEENNILSDDNKKSDSFDIFWKKYHKGSKKNAFKAWGKLKDQQREKALNNVDSYLLYCKRSDRPLKDASTYLNGECFNDDWLEVPECYRINDYDNDRIRRFKEYMVNKFPDLIYHRNPLTFEQADRLMEDYGVAPFEEAMRKLCERDIHQYYSIKCGVETILKEMQDDDI